MWMACSQSGMDQINGLWKISQINLGSLIWSLLIPQMISNRAFLNFSDLPRRPVLQQRHQTVRAMCSWNSQQWPYGQWMHSVSCRHFRSSRCCHLCFLSTRKLLSCWSQWVHPLQHGRIPGPSWTKLLSHLPSRFVMFRCANHADYTYTVLQKKVPTKSLKIHTLCWCIHVDYMHILHFL